MPVMHFQVRWPDQTELNCYSPSLVIQDFLQVGEIYSISKFLELVREALNIASERVRAKYGFACSQALDQLGEIEIVAARFSDHLNQKITVTGFTD
jgi:uncharacterized repeat protein (TIGR04042 family)